MCSPIIAPIEILRDIGEIGRGAFRGLVYGRARAGPTGTAALGGCRWLATSPSSTGLTLAPMVVIQGTRNPSLPPGLRPRIGVRGMLLIAGVTRRPAGLGRTRRRGPFCGILINVGSSAGGLRLADNVLSREKFMLEDNGLHLPSLSISGFRGIDELHIPRLGR